MARGFTPGGRRAGRVRGSGFSVFSSLWSAGVFLDLCTHAAWFRSPLHTLLALCCLAVLVRPQTLLCAPFIGLLIEGGRRDWRGLAKSGAIATVVAVLTVSPGLAQLYVAAYVKTPVVLRNCHDDRLDASGVPALKDRLKLPSDAFVIVIVGNWKAGQELDPLLRTLASGSGNIHLALVGGGYHLLDASVDALGLEGRVHKLGRLPAPQIVPALAGADAAAVVYYARSENYRNALPNGFFQSIAAGLPVLYPDLPEIRTIAERGGFGLLVDWSSEAEIALAIAEISENPKQHQQLRANAQKAARALSWEKEELIFANVLSGCLAEAVQKGS